MNFKQALIAHLQGELVEVRRSNSGEVSNFLDFYRETTLDTLHRLCDAGSIHTFRLAPRTIMCNGVEVVAGEKEHPRKGCTFYVPDIYSDTYVYENSWNAHPDVHRGYFDRGLVYLNKEDAIARAKAMLIAQEVK